MSSLHTMKLDLAICLVGSAEREFEAHVSYWFTPAWPPTREDPGCEATIEIDSIQISQLGEYYKLPSWIVDALTDEDLIAQCFSDKAASDEYARELAYEARLEELRGSK